MVDVTHELLERIASAFNRNDVEAIVAHFHVDGVFVNAIGPAETGDVYVGRDAIRAFFANLFAANKRVSWNILPPNQIDGSFAVTRWRRLAVDNNGNESNWLGCDVYEFRDQLIVKKDTYIKVVK